MNGQRNQHAGPNGAVETSCDIPLPWRELEPPNGQRRVFARSETKGGSKKVSLRGELVAPFGEPRRLVFESNLEKRNLLCLLVRNDVAKVEDQRPRVSYVDAWGTGRTHTFDALITMADGERIAAAVKPVAVAERGGRLDELRLIARQMSRQDADRVVMLLEKDAPRVTVANAKLVLAMRALPDPDHDRAVAGLLVATEGPASVASLIKASSLAPADAFAAVVRLFGAGDVRVLGNGLIGHDAVVERTALAVGGSR
jgi:hypothetical protein